MRLATYKVAAGMSARSASRTELRPATISLLALARRGGAEREVRGLEPPVLPPADLLAAL